MGIWVIVCIQKPSHHFLQIFRPLHMFEIVFRDSSFYPKQYLHFVCYGLSAQTSPKRLVWKTGIWRQIMMSQTTHTKYKWHHMPLNENPMKIFCVRPCLMITMAVLHLSPVSLNIAVHLHTPLRQVPIRPGAQPRGGHLPPVIFKTLHSNFDICRNFQRIKMKFYILIIFKKSYWNFSLSC